MKNLMDALSPRHLSLRRKIKALDKKIPLKEKELEELSNKYAGKVGRIKKDDVKRQKDKDKMNDLKREISLLKSQRRKYKNIWKLLNRLVIFLNLKLIRLLLINLIDYMIKGSLCLDEIRKFLENLKDHLDDALHHILNNDVPSTNNLIELFFKITFGGNLKRHFRTTRCAYKRMKFNEIQWS